LKFIEAKFLTAEVERHRGKLLSAFAPLQLNKQNIIKDEQCDVDGRIDYSFLLLKQDNNRKVPSLISST
jgi:hypothetical protein